MQFKHANFIVLLLCVLAIGSARADHLPYELLAVSKPEVQLARINLKTSKLPDVIRLYGQPTSKRDVASNPEWTGYTWDWPHGKLEVDIAHEAGVIPGSSKAQIIDVYIEGAIQDHARSTGRGLKLGDTLADLNRIYGKLYELSAPNGVPSSTREPYTGVQESSEYRVATIQWRKEEFTLRVGFDVNGKVDAIWPIVPECYPHGCG